MLFIQGKRVSKGLASREHIGRIKALLLRAEHALNSGVVLASMAARDVFFPPSAALLEERLDDALRVYKSPMIARYAIRRGADPNKHADAFAENARDGETGLMGVMLEGGLRLDRRGTRLSSTGLCVLYAAAHGKQPETVSFLMKNAFFNAQELESVTEGRLEIGAIVSEALPKTVSRPEPESQTGKLAPVAGAFNFSAIKTGALRLLPQKIFQNGAKNSM